MKKDLSRYLKPGDIVFIPKANWIDKMILRNGVIRTQEEELRILNKYNRELSIMAFIGLLILVVASFLIR